MSTLLSAKSQGNFWPFSQKNPSKSINFSKKPPQINPAGHPSSPAGKSKAPRQTRGCCSDESRLRASERGVRGGISPLVQRPPGGLSVHFPPVESGRTPHSVSLRGPRLIKPPRSPEKPAPCGMTAALAAEARFAGRQRRRCGVSAPAGAELFPPADTVGPGSFDRISRRTQRLSSSRYYGSRARRGWSGGTDLR
mgnify:CR=1 FL=1